MDNQWVGAAIKAHWEGDLPLARRLLSEYVDRCPMDERGWLWLGRVAERPEQKSAAYRRALRINPFNEVAGIELEASLQNQTAEQIPSIQTLPTAGGMLKLATSTGGWVAFAAAACIFAVLAAAVFPIFLGDRTLVTMSGSMEPVIPTGAVVVVEPVPSENLRVGDVIAFAPSLNARSPIVHRIVKISEKGDQRFLTTRGDANDSADVEEITLPATAWRAWYMVPLAGYLIAFATSSFGVVSLIVLPVLGLAILSLRDWLKDKRWGQLRKYLPEFPL